LDTATSLWEAGLLRAEASYIVVSNVSTSAVLQIILTT
jgi:hypothetical protein